MSILKTKGHAVGIATLAKIQVQFQPLIRIIQFLLVVFPKHKLILYVIKDGNRKRQNNKSLDASRVCLSVNEIKRKILAHHSRLHLSCLCSDSILASNRFVSVV